LNELTTKVTKNTKVFWVGDGLLMGGLLALRWVVGAWKGYFYHRAHGEHEVFLGGTGLLIGGLLALRWAVGGWKGFLTTEHTEKKIFINLRALRGLHHKPLCTLCLRGETHAIIATDELWVMGFTLAQDTDKGHKH
jgi:hypothetical protein